MGVMFRPVSTLEFSISADHSDIVDSEPPLGSSIYSMGTTIGGVGGRATMDALTFRASWTPVENVDFLGSYRIADLSGDNRLNDLYMAIAYTFTRNPFVRVGYGLGYADVDDPAPTYTEGTSSTPYYYDPANRLTHHIYIEHVRMIGSNLHYGTEARIILDEDGGTGAALSTYIQYRWSDHQSLRLDARYFTQNHSRDRNNNQSGHYDAINLIAIYEYRF
jgi:hypothetical protein